MIKKSTSILFFSLALFVASAFSQSSTQVEKAKAYITSMSSELNVQPEDVKTLTHVHTATLNNGAGFIHYFNQSIDGVFIDNAIVNVAEFASGEYKVTGNRAINDAASKARSASFTLAPELALEYAAKKLGEAVKANQLSLTQVDENTYSAGALDFVDNAVVINKKLILSGNAIIAVWAMEMDVKASPDYFNIFIDAKTGDLVHLQNYTTYCNHGKPSNHGSHSCSGHSHSSDDEVAPAAAAAGDGATYRVYDWPGESPIHTTHELVVDPSDPVASPFGWHDTDGADGAEYTITRGNNVHAYQDRADAGTSAFDEPDGGEELVFDYAHQQDSEPVFSDDAAVVNLFYQVNKLHDFTHYFGFNEGNGNFQSNNYSNGGASGDFVRAEAQDGSGTNNANFATPGDGDNGRMQMYLYNVGGDRLLSVEEPGAIAGFIDVGLKGDDAGWAFEYADSPVTAPVIVATDGSFSGGTQCCNAIENASEVSGNIALIDRGACFFSEKAANAEAAGASACIICNVVGVNGGTGDELLTMAAADGITVNIPTVFMGKSDCDLIRGQIASGEQVIIKIEERETTGPSQLDASFANGIIAHEFGHGVSTRFTGGPGNSGCLFNLDTDGDGEPDSGEQMGEGWSDWLALVATVEEGDGPEDVRGIGVYTNNEGVDGRGIRTFPYSTDMNVNPLTYNGVTTGSVPHGVGTVWCTMLWDMYWAFVDLYGYDADYKNTESGNYRAIKLVMDAMMIQPCRPGFVDGRDAIMAADDMNYAGVHNCMLWEVFARRGLGYLADQGDSMDHLDGFENFDPLPTCIKTLKVAKTSTKLVTPGESIEVEIYMANHTETPAMNVVVTDEIPEGLTYGSSTASVEPTVVGNMITWEFGERASLAEESFTVTYVTDPSIKSERIIYDPINDIDYYNDFTGEGRWEVGFDEVEGVNLWSAVTINPNSGNRSWWVESVATESDQYLDMHNLEVTGADNPVLRFWHSHNTEFRADGGFVLVSLDGGQTFQFVDDKFILNGYNSELQYGTFAIPSLQAFSGEEKEYYDSYLDLSAFAGETITVRFRWGSDDNTSPTADPTYLPGWYIDDVEFLDLKLYETTACISADNAGGVCSVVNKTIVDTGLPLSSTSDFDVSGTDMQVFPNPTSGLLTVELREADRTIDYAIGLYNMQGQQVKQVSVAKGDSYVSKSIDASDLSDGMYLLQVSSKNGILTEKVVLSK